MERELKDILKEAKRDNLDYKMKAAKHYEDGGDYKSAFRWYLEVADEGKIEAYVKVGDYYFEGKGTKQDYQKALEMYTKASAYNIPEAIEKIALMYKEGLGVETDQKEVFELYEKASNIEETGESLYNLGLMYRNGTGTEKDDQKAYNYFLEASKKNHVQAKVNVGFCLCNGIGVDKDPETGVNYYKEAAVEKNVTALFNLAMCYKTGFVVEKDTGKAIELLEEASKSNHPNALFELAKMYETEVGFRKNIGFALDCYQRAINAGCKKAAINLARLYFERKETKKAVDCLEKNIDDISVKYELGKYYLEGIYLEKNNRKALTYLSEAAKSNHPLAQYYMGLAYLNGEGLAKDEAKAIECFEISSDNDCDESTFALIKILENAEPKRCIDLLEKLAKKGNPEALYKLGYYYFHGKCVEKDYEKAVYYYQLAADKDNASAQCNLGLCYLNGKGIEKNYEFGAYWLERASHNNSILASYNLAYCYENGIGVKRDEIKAIRYYISSALNDNFESKIGLYKIYKKNNDYVQAFYWINEAVKEDKDEAYLELAKLYIDDKFDGKDGKKAETILESVKDKNSDNYFFTKGKIKEFNYNSSSI